MSAIQVERGAALKEWAAVVKALEAGEQILVLRKGGVREEGFSADAPAFYFYPTGFHQTPEKLRPDTRHFLDEAMADRPAEGIVRIASIGRIADTFSVPTAEKLAELAGEYIYTVDEMIKRNEFRPGESLTALAVRVYKMETPVDIPFKPGYGGCVSWIKLDDPMPAGSRTPALSDESFDRRLRAVRSILS